MKRDHIFLLVFTFGSVVSVGAPIPAVTCNTNSMTKQLCTALRNLEQCNSESSKCDGNDYVVENFASYLFYLGEVVGLTKALHSQGFFSGEIRNKVTSFSKANKNGDRFFASSRDWNLPVLVNRLNKKSREVAAELGKLH